MRPTTKVILNGRTLSRRTDTKRLNITELKIWTLMRAGAYPVYIRQNLNDMGFKGKVKIVPSNHVAFKHIKKEFPEWY